MRPWPGLEPYTRQVTLPDSGLCLHVYDAGPRDAPALVLLHGLGDEADTWRYLIPPLAQRYRVLAPDLPGFGRSAGLRRYTLPGVLDTLWALLDALALSQVTLLGNSLGAMLGQALALARPERVRQLVLLDGGLVNRQPLSLGLLLFMTPGLGEWLYTRLRRDPQAAYASLRPFYADLDGLPQADRDFLFRRVNARVWSDRQRRAYLALLRRLGPWLAGMQKQLPAQLAGLSAPTLILYGEQDAINSPENGRALAALLPSARLAFIPGAGHLPHQERPEAVLAELRAAGIGAD